MYAAHPRRSEAWRTDEGHHAPRPEGVGTPRALSVFAMTRYPWPACRMVAMVADASGPTVTEPEA